ncbi:glycoside hydrolase [Granulicella sp. WH15]|uniref:WD40/YVTN/BNR-like repeat-containing protein n=1 Tax=Granulicella sp. WH15 TaxID=2602070 RepID=UPI0013A55950|nr:glycoside hydrolase [Granulicella sp. WH15]
MAQAGGVPPQLFSDMRWREIGPMRAGRTRALAGVPSQPATFYLGAVNGGVWKTTDAGETWQSLWDAQPSGSIGTIAVSLSDPNVVYVGSGEGLERPDLSTGDGVYKSTDAGKTWQHLGLRDGQQIGQIAIDPKDPNRVFVAVTGHPYGPNTERGLYRTLDGGKTFQRVLYVDDKTGASEVQIDPQHPNIVFAATWQRQQGPWENGAFSGPGGLYRSTDGGDTWKKLSGNGLPDDILQVQMTISPSDSRRMYAEVGNLRGGVQLLRSDDEGVTWVHAPDNDTRPEARIGGGDVPVPVVDPKDPNTVYVASVVTWKSTDAGKSWYGLRGAPGGDDYQNVFINPNNTDIIALASDQGVIISQNAGKTWSQWFNQATAQVYHVTTDNAFPYRVCGGQQDSGSACVPSRSDDGRITFHDWHPVGIEEYGYAAPDPLDPDIVYGGKVTRYDRRTGQIQDVEPKPLRSYRVLRTQPLQFSPVDPHSLYFAANTLWLTKNGGHDWKEISPDLSRESYELPATLDAYKDSPAAKPVRRGVIYSLGLSPVDINRLWAGTDDGLIWTTADGGGHWQNVTPPALKPFWKVFNMDAGHFDALTDYAAVNTMRLDDMRPHLFRTHDGGRTWKEIVNGIPDGAATSAIREDPKRKGLLYAGTETQVYVSFDDGDHWQSLRLNMPASSVRDLSVKGDDLIAGTHGRGFLILDNVTPLRQIAEKVAAANAYLYAPQTAIRIRNNMNPPTPWVPEMATGENPPAGAMIDYVLGPQFSGEVMLEILDASGKPITRIRSTDPVPPLDPRYPDPVLWARPPRVLSAAPGHHRFLWDMRYPEVPGMSTGPDADEAVPHNTPSVATSPWVLPGSYTVRLTAGGKVLTEPLQVVLDPRVKTSTADLEAQFTASRAIYDDMLRATVAIHEITVLRDQLHSGGSHVSEANVASLEAKLNLIAGAASGGGGRRGVAGPPTLGSVRTTLARLEHSIQNADAAPTTAQLEACQIAAQPLAGLLEQWQTLKQTDLKVLNQTLLKRHLPLLSLNTGVIDHDVEDQIELGDEP